MPNTLFHLQFPPPELPKQFVRESFFESLDGWNVYIEGTGSVSMDTNGIIMETGLTSGGVAIITENLLHPIQTLNWSKNRSLKINAAVEVQDDPNSLIFICTGSELGWTRGFGFQFLNNKVIGFSRNGADYHTIDLEIGLTPPYTFDALIEAVLTAGSKVQFYIDDVLRGTLTQGIPTGITWANQIARLVVASGAAVNHRILTSHIKVTQEE